VGIRFGLPALPLRQAGLIFFATFFHLRKESKFKNSIDYLKN